MMKDIFVPNIGDFDEVEIIEIHVSLGEKVEIEQSLITLESDKATMDIPSPNAGIVKEINIAQGQNVSQGDLILKLETQETNRAIAREKQQRTQIHLQEIREAKSRAESDTRALHVELNSLEKQEISMQSEINQQIALQSRLVDGLPELEDHEAQSIERTKAIENRRQELETLATELGAKRSDIDVRSASINERENYLKRRLTEIENRLQGYNSERDQE